MRTTLVLVASMLLAACSGGADANCSNPARVKLSDLQASIFTPSCATSACHAGNHPAQSLTLEDGKSHAALVGVRSTLDSSRMLVAPGDPSASELWHQISEGAMPEDSDPLTQAQVNQVRDWICNGAPEN